MTDSRGLNKSYSRSHTLPQDVTQPQQAHRELLRLAEDVGQQLRHDKQLARLVTVQLRTCEFYDWSHQIQLEQPSDATLEIYQAACRACDAMWQGSPPLRQLSLSAGRVSREALRQLTLFGNSYEKLARLDAAVDSIRGRFGEKAVQRAALADGRKESLPRKK